MSSDCNITAPKSLPLPVLIICPRGLTCQNPSSITFISLLFHFPLSSSRLYCKFQILLDNLIGVILDFGYSFYIFKKIFMITFVEYSLAFLVKICSYICYLFINHIFLNYKIISYIGFLVKLIIIWVFVWFLVQFHM